MPRGDASARALITRAVIALITPERHGAARPGRSSERADSRPTCSVLVSPAHSASAAELIYGRAAVTISVASQLSALYKYDVGVSLHDARVLACCYFAATGDLEVGSEMRIIWVIQFAQNYAAESHSTVTVTTTTGTRGIRKWLQCLSRWWQSWCNVTATGHRPTH